MKLNIKNFQSIAEADIEIGPLTVLVGQSDVGKSAVIRALRLLHRNSGGLELVKHGTGGLYIQQNSDDGTTVAIAKGRGQNTYYAGSKVLSKIGKEIPPEVANYLRTDELALDKDLTLDLNFSGQFDSPFLLADSSSVVTKAISSLSGINILYSAIREANSEAQKLKAKGDVLTESIKGLLKYDHLYLESEQVKKLFESLTVLGENIEKTQSENISKKSQYRELLSLEHRTIDSSSLDKHYKVVTDLQENLKKSYSRRDSLKACKDKLFGISEFTLTQEYTDNITNLGSSVEKLAYVQTIISEKWDKLAKLKSALSILNEIEVQNTNHCAEQYKAEDEYAEIKSQIKICEACGRPL